jgi:hypothetical protein
LRWLVVQPIGVFQVARFQSLPMATAAPSHLCGVVKNLLKLAALLLTSQINRAGPFDQNLILIGVSKWL